MIFFQAVGKCGSLFFLSELIKIRMTPVYAQMHMISKKAFKIFPPALSRFADSAIKI